MPLPSRYEARIVELLDDGRGYTITELATMLGTTRQNVHKLVRRLGQRIGVSSTGGDIYASSRVHQTAIGRDVDMAKGLRLGEQLTVTGLHAVLDGVCVELTREDASTVEVTFS